MNIAQLAKHSHIPIDILTTAAKAIGIDTEDLSQEDIMRLHAQLQKEPNGATASDLRFLAKVNPATIHIKKVRNPFLGGAPLIKPEFLLTRADDPIRMVRNTRNCGDTAGLVLKGLRKLGVSMVEERDKTLKELLDFLVSPPRRHEIWQVTLHQHTFTVERCMLGNWIVQSYQSPTGTYDVNFWCGLDGPFIDDGAKAPCGDLPDRWYFPSNEDLKLLAKMIEALYAAKAEERAAIWADLPFHPGDTGKVLEQTVTLAFDADCRILNGVNWKPATVAGLELILAKPEVAEEKKKETIL